MNVARQLTEMKIGDLLRDMAFAIADGQYQLDENSVNVAEMMGGLRSVYDEKGELTFDDSRVFFGYEYMTITEALAYAAIDDALTGKLDKEEQIDMQEVVKSAIAAGLKAEDKETKGLEPNDDLNKYTPPPDTNDLQIRVPVRLSMLELGFTPVSYTHLTLPTILLV